MKRAVVLVLAACSRRAEIASCDDDLRGVYVADGERWMVLDSGATLEAYPLFPDGGPPGERVVTPPGRTSAGAPAALEIAPRVIDLARAAAGGATPVAISTGADLPRDPAPLAGTLRRRYMRRAERCDAQVPVHVTRCAGDALELVLGDPSPPLGFSPCTWPGPGPSRVVRWRRE
jgi:hypothetical protein